MTELVRLIVRSNGVPLKPGQREWWRVEREDGSTVLERSRQPFFAGARALLAAGVDPDALVTMRHAGSEIDSFKPMRIGAAAALSISETETQSIRLVKWIPRPDFDQSDAAG